MPTRERASKTKVKQYTHTHNLFILSYLPFLLIRYEQLSEQEERSYQQLRKKLYTELQQERDKLTAEMNGHNSALEKQIKDIKVQ